MNIGNFDQWVAEQHIRSFIFMYHYWKTRGQTEEAFANLRCALTWRKISPKKVKTKICSKCKKEIKDSHWWEWTHYDSYFHHNCADPENPKIEDIEKPGEA